MPTVGMRPITIPIFTIKWKNKIEASKSNYKGLFTSKLVGSSKLTINTISGVGKFESYYDYKSGVPKGYNFLDYINCRFF